MGATGGLGDAKLSMDVGGVMELWGRQAQRLQSSIHCPEPQTEEGPEETRRELGQRQPHNHMSHHLWGTS